MSVFRILLNINTRLDEIVKNILVLHIVFNSIYSNYSK